MKPRIFKNTAGWWTVEYGYWPRTMWLFGASAEERRKITELCVADTARATWKEAVEHLCVIYRAGQIRREVVRVPRRESLSMAAPKELA